MKILMLNWRDARNPKSGGAEALTEGILRELAAKGHEITLFAAGFRDAAGLPAPRKEMRDGYRIIRRGGPFSVRFAAAWYWITRGRREHFDVVIDQIHGLPFFTPLYVREKNKRQPAGQAGGSPRRFAFIHEVAGEIWFAMYPYPIALLGRLAEAIYFRLYRKSRWITVSESTKADLVAEGIPEKNISIIPEAIEMPTDFIKI